MTSLKYLVPSVYCEVLVMYTVMCTIVQLTHLALLFSVTNAALVLGMHQLSLSISNKSVLLCSIGTNYVIIFLHNIKFGLVG